MLRQIVIALFVVAALGLTVHAEGHPSLSGTWKMDPIKSNMGGGPFTSARTDVISQDGSKFTDKVTTPDASYTLAFTDDGKKVSVDPDSPEANTGEFKIVEIAGSWEGAKLVVSMKLSYNGQVELTSRDTYSLTGDGKTLTIVSQLNTPGGGGFDSKLIFAKQ